MYGKGKLPMITKDKYIVAKRVSIFILLTICS